MKTFLSALSLGALALAGCSSSGGAVDAGPPDMAKHVYDLTGTRSGIGDKCASGRSAAGTCGDSSQECITDGVLGFNGGYCVADCTSSGCPDDSQCVALPTGDNLCMAACNVDSDCRDGYVCSDYQVCQPALGLYFGSEVRPGTKPDGTACDPTPQTPGADFAANVQLSGLEGGVNVNVAVDPFAGNVIVTWLDNFSGTIQVASSQDDGNSWNPPITLPADTSVDNNSAQAYPVAAVDSTGAFYVAWVGRGNDPDNVYVARSDDGGMSFNTPVIVTSPDDGVNAGSLTRPSIAIGPTDNVYVAWETTINAASVIRGTFSSDGGTTFAPPVDLSADDGVNHMSDRIAVSADGTVYATWLEISGDFNGDVQNDVAVQAFKDDLTPIGLPVVASAASDAVAFDVPSIVVRDTKVYVVYTVGNPEGQWNIQAAVSLDGALTFKKSVKVNSDASCATHLHPAASLDDAGLLNVAFEDNRNLDGAVRYTLGTTSGAGVLTFSSEEVVNDMPYPFTTETSGLDYLGRYFGLVTVNGAIYIAWTDPRTNGTSQVFFSGSGF